MGKPINPEHGYSRGYQNDSLDAERHFSYADARVFCEQNGLVLIESWLDAPDQVFFDAGLTQAQIDVIMRQHIWQVKHLFTPSIYTRKQRFMLAFSFLFK